MMLLRVVLLAAMWLFCPPPLHAADAFQQWLEALWPDAQKIGVSRATFDIAVRGLEPDFSLPDLVVAGQPERQAPGQAEFVQTPADYLKEASLARLAAQGRKLAEQHRTVLQAIERQFGVQPSILLAIWGRETAFGGYKLPNDAIRVLATQAYAGRRKDFFRGEFLSALRLLEDGVPRAILRSSWGGAMGLTQLLPGEYYKYAVDFDGDGRADIWSSVPDALASAAKQLVGKGWQRGEAWAYEVRVPRGTDCTIAEPEVTMSIGEWIGRGFEPVRGRPRAEELARTASLLMPEGLQGPAFLTPKNYFVLKDYNFSDLYVLFVGNLADRIAGGGPFATPWTRTSQLATAQLEAIQRVLSEKGFYRDRIDGKAGMKTRSALGAYQKANGLAVDCWPGPAVLEHMHLR